MPNNFHESLFLKINTSHKLKRLVYGLHLLAVSSCWLADLPVNMQWVSTGAILGFWGLHEYRHKAMAIYLKYATGSGWQVSWDGDDFQAIMILDTSVITRWAIFLHYANEYPPQLKGYKGQVRKSLLILNDALSADDYRRLMVKLKLSARSQSC